tara:strand:+ start:317 stop:838 length:522 start_codon:yes stop_codon:yes gene_type:complete
MTIALPNEYDNPYTIVHNKLWEMAEANHILEKWLDKGNKEKFDKRIGQKKSISTADMPELLLVSRSTSYDLKISTSATRLSKEYVWGLATGDQRLNRVLNQISWELFRAMASWENHLCGTTWNGKRFVLQAVLSSSEDSPPGDLSTTEKGILGWTSILTMEVQMQFTTEDLLL